jgi:hypothetical protein
VIVVQDRRLLLIRGKEKRERADFSARLYKSLRKQWRVCLRDAVSTQSKMPLRRSEIDILGEVETAASKTTQPDEVAAPFLSESTADTVVASVSSAAGTDESLTTESIRLHIIDLDRQSPKDSMKAALRHIRRTDADKIGSFSGIVGLIEVGLGSILHAYKVPFKGHFLSSLQNLLLISFGKALNGRGLVRISFISAMLKAFSPMGGALRPMLFIFLQGAVFSLPTYLIGWNIFSVLAGSVLMGWLTLGMSLGMDYLMFGKSFFDAAQAGIGHVLGSIGVDSPSLSGLLLFVLLVRAAVSVAVGAVAYFGDVLPIVSRAADAVFRRQNARTEPNAPVAAKGGKKVSAAAAALFGIFRPKFLVAFLLSVLLMRFFTDLSSAELTTTAVRGICISYLGFLLMHRIDVQALGARLDKRFGLDLEKSLPIAAKRIGRPTGRD